MTMRRRLETIKLLGWRCVGFLAPLSPLHLYFRRRRKLSSQRLSLKDHDYEVETRFPSFTNFAINHSFVNCSFVIHDHSHFFPGNATKEAAVSSWWAMILLKPGTDSESDWHWLLRNMYGQGSTIAPPMEDKALQGQGSTRLEILEILVAKRCMALLKKIWTKSSWRVAVVFCLKEFRPTGWVRTHPVDFLWEFVLRTSSAAGALRWETEESPARCTAGQGGQTATWHRSHRWWMEGAVGSYTALTMAIHIPYEQWAKELSQVFPKNFKVWELLIGADTVLYGCIDFAIELFQTSSYLFNTLNVVSVIVTIYCWCGMILTSWQRWQQQEKDRPIYI